MTLMLIDDWEKCRLVLMWYSSDMTNTLQEQMQLGKDWRPLFYKIYVFNRLLDIYLEYTPQTLAAYTLENTNFFTVEEMLVLQEKINDMVDLDYNLDFLL